MKRNTDRATLRWIYHNIGTTKRWILLLLIVRIVLSVISVVYAFALRNVIDSATSGQQDIFFNSLGLFCLLILSNLALQAISRHLTHKSSVYMERQLRMNTYSKLLLRSYPHIAKLHVGEWINRLTSDSAVVVNAIIQMLPGLASTLVGTVATFVLLMQLSPRLVYIVMPTCLLLGAISLCLRPKLKALHAQTQEKESRALGFLLERLSSMLIIRAFNKERTSIETANEKMDDFVATKMKHIKFINFCSTGISTAIQGAQLMTIGICCWGIVKKTTTYGTMSAILHLISQLSTSLSGVSSYFHQYQSMLVSAERLMEIEHFPIDMQKPQIPQDQIRKYYHEDFSALELENVSFGYDEDDVLTDVNLQIAKGQIVAFTGQSGCGKSTIIKLLLNVYPLNTGSMRLRDNDGQAIPLDSSWRGLFAYVPQGYGLLSGSIREVVTFCDKELMTQDEKIWRALEIACAADFVRQLPNGLETTLGERGSGLSDGQMQRISIARAILSNRPILLLDEATSALDVDTETQLLKNLQILTDKTVLTITHRPAVLAYCDKCIHFG